IFRNAVGKFAGIAERRHVHAIRTRSSYIEQDKLQRPSESAVGACHIAENILPRPEAKLLSDWPIDQDQRGSEMSRRLDAMNIEPFVTRGAYERQENEHHLWRAP